MINAKTTDLIRIELDELNGRSVTLTGAQWLNVFDTYKKWATFLFNISFDVNNEVTINGLPSGSSTESTKL